MKKAVKNWWVSLLVGVLAIIVGIWCFASPGSSLLGMTYVFVAAFFLEGIMDICFALSNRNSMYGWGWGWTLAGGTFEVLLGIILLCLPTESITVILMFLVGFWRLSRSVMSIGESYQLQMMGARGWGWGLALSILSVIFAFLYLLSPAWRKGAFIVILMGISMILYGVFRIVMAFKLRGIGKNGKDIME